MSNTNEPLQLNPAEKTTGIKEVFSYNFIEEIKKITGLLEKYPYIGMDTEFPGTVYHVETYSKDFYYRTIKLNVENLNLIQLGITLTDKDGNYPPDIHTWQFNLQIDVNKEKFNPASLNLLLNSGIDFNKLKTDGIKQHVFAEYFTVSGLVLNPEVHWISFHGSYDFGYLLKLCLNLPLPESEEEFTDELNLYFPNHYDIKILTQGNNQLQGSLNRLAGLLDVLRVGKTHQAGSDSVVTVDVFFKLIKHGLIDEETIEEGKNILYGVGLGADNNETINYTKIGNSGNSSLNNSMNNGSSTDYPGMYQTGNNVTASNYNNMLAGNYLKNMNLQSNIPSPPKTLLNPFFVNNMPNLNTGINPSGLMYDTKFLLRKFSTNSNLSAENSKTVSS